MDHPSSLNCIKLYETVLLSTTVDDLVSYVKGTQYYFEMIKCDPKLCNGSSLLIDCIKRFEKFLWSTNSEPIFYGDLVYKFKRIVGKPNFSDRFKKVVKRYIRAGYNLDIMRQSACLVLNPITVYS